MKNQKIELSPETFVMLEGLNSNLKKGTREDLEIAQGLLEDLLSTVTEALE